MLRHAAVGLLLTLASPVLADGMGFQQLLSGQEVPLNLMLKDLSGDWRRLSIATTDARSSAENPMSQLMQAGMMADKGKGKEDAAAAMIGMSLLGGLFGGGGESAAPVYYTKGQTLAVGGETFLVAYRYKKPEMNFLQMAMEADKAEKGGKEPDFAKMASDGKLNPESSLRLSLINVRAISSLNDIRPFDLNQEIAEGAGSGGLMEFIAEQAAKEAAKEAEAEKQKPVAVVKPATAKKPAARPKAKP
jgi:hypothetical protein